MSCTEDGSSGDLKKLTQREAAECKMREGAVWYSSLEHAQYCRILATDIGKKCSKRTDCQEECEAETRTCQSLPDVGISVLDENGQVVEGPVE